jgi:hypothetical protein
MEVNVDGLTKSWKCGNGHQLGQVVRVEVNNNGRKHYVTRLNLYRHAIDMQAETPEEVDVIAVLEGTTLNVRCDVPGCGASRAWFIGQEAMEHLVGKMREREKGVV